MDNNQFNPQQPAAQPVQQTPTQQVNYQYPESAPTIQEQTPVQPAAPNMPAQQVYYQQPMQQYPYDSRSMQPYYKPPTPPKHSFAIAALVLGIVSIVTGLWAWWLSLILGITGICLSNKAKKEGNNEGMNRAGMVLCIIGLALASLGAITVIACTGCAACNAGLFESGALEDLFDSMYY